MNAQLLNPRRLVALALVSLAAVILIAASGQPAAVAQSSGAKIVQIPLVAGDSLQVRFTEPFKAGDLADGFVPRAEVAADKVISGVVMVKKGAPVAVTVAEDAASGNGRAGKAGTFALIFDSVEAVDGQTVALGTELAREGSGKGIILKIFTLFLIKGENPEVTPDEIFWPQFAEDTYVYAEQK